MVSVTLTFILKFSVLNSRTTEKNVPGNARPPCITIIVITRIEQTTATFERNVLRWERNAIIMINSLIARTSWTFSTR